MVWGLYDGVGDGVLVVDHTSCQSCEVPGVCAAVLLSVMQVLLAGRCLAYGRLEKRGRPASN